MAPDPWGKQRLSSIWFLISRYFGTELQKRVLAGSDHAADRCDPFYFGIPFLECRSPLPSGMAAGGIWSLTYERQPRCSCGFARHLHICQIAEI
jgi:hypothetical protein